MGARTWISRVGLLAALVLGGRGVLAENPPPPAPEYGIFDLGPYQDRLICRRDHWKM